MDDVANVSSVDCIACVANTAAGCPRGIPDYQRDDGITHSLLWVGRLDKRTVRACELTRDPRDGLWGQWGNGVWFQPEEP